MANPQEVQRLLQALGGDMYAQSLYNSAQSAGKIASQNAMEDLNSRGILNSTETAKEVAGANNGVMSDLYSKLLSYKNQRDQEAEAKRRWNAEFGLKQRELEANLAKLNQDQNNEQGIWNDLSTQMQRRSHFLNNRDFTAQLQREGIDSRLGGEGWNALLTRLQNEYTGTDASGNPVDNVRGSLYNGYKDTTSRVQPAIPGRPLNSNNINNYYGRRNTKKLWGW